MRWADFLTTGEQKSLGKPNLTFFPNFFLTFFLYGTAVNVTTIFNNSHYYDYYLKKKNKTYP